MTQTPTIGIVLPCYNEEEILLQTDKKIGALVEQLINKKLIATGSSIIYIDDGSKDKTWELIQDRVNASNNRVGIKFSRNFGHQSALLGGITSIYQQVDCIITIDADLQDDIGVIEDMIVKYRQGFEVVYGVRKKRDSDSAFKRRTAEGFYLLMRRMGVNIIYNHADFRLASNRVCENLLRFGEVNLFLRGIFPLIGFNSTTVYYDRSERKCRADKVSIDQNARLCLGRYHFI
jgi:glycosyltransferase involved in cell wall biosynthesis